jgi:hypothetical protein
MDAAGYLCSGVFVEWLEHLPECKMKEQDNDVNPPAAGARQQSRDEALWGTVQAEIESLKNESERYRLTLAAIRDSELTGVDFGDWVQAAVQDALDGLMPECPNCGTFVHEGACVEEAEEEKIGGPDSEDGNA